MDAGIATALCQGVYNPQASGIGGGGFIMVRSANGSVEVIDAREPAPAASSQEMFTGTAAVRPLELVIAGCKDSTQLWLGQNAAAAPSLAPVRWQCPLQVCCNAVHRADCDLPLLCHQSAKRI